MFKQPRPRGKETNQMKRKFFECAILLGIVMSVMFLAQTQDGIGHSANMHDPVIHVDGSGNEVAFGQGNDPRGRSFWKCSNGANIGNMWSEGWQYEGGLLNGATEDQTNDPTNSGHPRDDKDQSIYVLQIRLDCNAYSNGCRSEIKPSIKYVDVLPRRDQTFQGWGSVELIFSGLCYQEERLGSDGRYYKHDVTIEETRWEKGEAIFLKVTLNEYADKRTGSWGAGLTQGPFSLSTSFSHEFEEKYNDLHARGFGLKAKLSYSRFDKIAFIRDKYAGASGYLEGASGGDIGAGLPGDDIDDTYDTYP